MHIYEFADEPGNIRGDDQWTRFKIGFKIGSRELLPSLALKPGVYFQCAKQKKENPLSLKLDQTKPSPVPVLFGRISERIIILFTLMEAKALNLHCHCR